MHIRASKSPEHTDLERETERLHKKIDYRIGGSCKHQQCRQKL